MSRKAHDTQKPSLVPEVQQQEAFWVAELEKARAEVAQAQAEAERAAQARLMEARKKLPQLVDQIKQQGVKEVKTTVQGQEQAGAGEIARLEGMAQRTQADAVQHILSLVLPRERA